MSLYRRPDTPNWWCRFQIANREIRLSTGTADRERAKEFEAAARARAWRQAYLGERAPYPWGAAKKRYLAELRRRNDPSVTTILNWLDERLEGHSIQDITREVVDELRQLKAAQASEATADRHMERLRAILRKCRDDWQVVDTIPKVPMYRPQKAEPRWLTRPQAKDLVRKLPTPELKLAARLALQVGLRMRAQAKLTWDRVDFRERRAWVPGYQMKAAKTLGIPLSSEAIRILRALKRIAGDSPYVHTWQGQPVDDFNTKAFKEAAAAAGVPWLRWHDLRHTWASWHVQKGTSLHELMQLGGWASYSMVLVYAHLAPDHLAEAAERLAPKRRRNKTRNNSRAA